MQFNLFPIILDNKRRIQAIELIVNIEMAMTINTNEIIFFTLNLSPYKRTHII